MLTYCVLFLFSLFCKALSAERYIAVLRKKEKRCIFKEENDYMIIKKYFQLKRLFVFD